MELLLYPTLRAEPRKIRHQRTFKSQTTRDNEKIKKRIKVNKNRIKYIDEYLNKFFATNVTSSILVSFAKLLCKQLNLKLDRLAKRNRSALLCWYSENWDLIYYTLNSVDLSLLLKSMPSEPSSPVSEPQYSFIDPSDINNLLNYHD